MNILYIGDIMGRPGRQTVKDILPGLITEKSIDFVIAQGENLSGGKGMKPGDIATMQEVGVNFFTGGNWTLANEKIFPLLQGADSPVIRPANYSETDPGRGWQIVNTGFGKILIISLLGQTVGYIQPELANPLVTIDAILEETKHENLIATVVNMHGDYSSEKLVIGQYLNGKATLVVGDHWHIPTADARILSEGTAHITDVGMVGSLDSCLGVQTDIIIKRWKTGQSSRNELELDGSRQFNAVLVKVDTATQRATIIEQIQRQINV